MDLKQNLIASSSLENIVVYAHISITQLLSYGWMVLTAIIVEQLKVWKSILTLNNVYS